jgi:ABC-type branched-subunit amino acid transport system permease subunit
LPFPVAVGLATAIVVGISVAVAVISARLQPIYVMVLTLGVQFTIENSLFTYGKLTGGLQAPVVPRPNFFGASLRNEHALYSFLLATTLVLMVLMERFRSSRFGRAMISVGNDQAGAAAVGINPWRYRVAAFAMGGLFAGIGGGLWAPQLGAPPGTGQFMAMQSLFYLAIPIFAGFDSILAVVLTGMFFMALPMALEQRHFQPMLLGGVALLFGVFLGPRGASGFVHDFSRRVRRSYRSDGVGGVARGLVPRRPRFPRVLPDVAARRAYRRARAESDGPSLWDHPLRIESPVAAEPASTRLPEPVGGRG